MPEKNENDKTLKMPIGAWLMRETLKKGIAIEIPSLGIKIEPKKEEK